MMMKIEVLFQEKIRLLRSFLEVTKDYQVRFKEPSHDVEVKMTWVDELSDLRESNLKAMQLLDQQIEDEKRCLNRSSIEKLQGGGTFTQALDETFALIKEIQLTDQSLFLYIQNMGFELRAQILKGLKEKEAMSKFKSQGQSPAGEGLDQTV
jgi:hypothetical protein